MQADTTTTFTYENIIYSESPSTVEANLKAAIDDGSFAKALSSIGLTLEDNSELFPAAAPPAPAPPSGGDDTNTAAIIAGSVVGGVVVLGAVAGGFVYMAKRKRSSQGEVYGGGAGTGSKKGEAMWSSNPAADGDDLEGGGGMKNSSSSKKQKSAKGATYGNKAFNMERDILDDQVDKDRNALFDSNASNLSAPGGTSYGAAAAGGAAAAAGGTFSNNAFQEVDALETPKAGGRDANPLFDSQNSQLSAPDTDRAYTSHGKAATEVSMMSARSRAESAQDGVRSNKLYGIDDDFEDADEGNNPAFESARSGKNDLLGTAESLGETYGGESGFNTARSGGLTDRSTNPLAEEGGANPLFGDQADGADEALPSRGFFGGNKKGKK